MFFFDPRYMLYMAPAFILMLAAQWFVKSAYNKWSHVATRNQITGAEAAERLIRYGNLRGVYIESVAGKLTDHYDPRSKVLRLSAGVYQGRTVAAMAIAAHELGHAMQDEAGYFPLRIRSMLVPAVNIGSTLGWILILVGLFLNITGLAWLGVIVFSAGALFALVTLPVELNASARAKELLSNSGLVITDEERRGVNSVLTAAALTYVAGLVTAIMQVLYYASLVSGGGRRRR